MVVCCVSKCSCVQLSVCIAVLVYVHVSSGVSVYRADATVCDVASKPAVDTAWSSRPAAS